MNTSCMLNISNFKTMFNAIHVCSTVFSIISICIVQVSNGDNVHFATCMFNSIISIMYVQVSNGDNVQHYLHVGPYIGDVSQEAEPGRYGSLCHIKVKVMKLYDYQLLSLHIANLRIMRIWRIIWYFLFKQIALLMLLIEIQFCKMDISHLSSQDY